MSSLSKQSDKRQQAKSRYDATEQLLKDNVFDELQKIEDKQRFA